MKSSKNKVSSVCAMAACTALLVLSGCGQKDASTSGEPASASRAAAGDKVPVTTASDEARALYMKGRALLDDLHFVEAHDEFAAAVEADPDFAMGHVMVAFTALSAGEFFDAVGKAADAAATASDGEQAMISALVAQSENDQASQKAALDKLLGMYPQDERVHMLMGNFMNGQQDFAAAARHFTRATEINPQFAGAYNALGYANRSLDKLDDAKAAFEKYVEILPNEANPHDSYAELLMEMGDYESSIEQYRESLSIDQYFSASYAGISRDYSLLGRPDMAQQTAEEMLAAARNFPERQNALFQSVMAHLFADNVDGAMAVCEKMEAEAEVKGDHAAAGGIYEYMGDVMLDQGQPAQAEVYYTKALERRQQADINAAAKEQAKRTHLFKTAIAAMIADDKDVAAERTAEYAAAAEARGTAFEKRRVHELQGYLAMTNDDMAGGAEHLAQASQLNPVVLYWSAVAHRELGNTEKAMQLAKRAANRNTLSPNLPFVRADALKMIEEMESA